jgi:hypothetical protein
MSFESKAENAMRGVRRGVICVFFKLIQFSIFFLLFKYKHMLIVYFKVRGKRGVAVDIFFFIFQLNTYRRLWEIFVYFGKSENVQILKFFDKTEIILTTEIIERGGGTTFILS